MQTEMRLCITIGFFSSFTLLRINILRIEISLFLNHTVLPDMETCAPLLGTSGGQAVSLPLEIFEYPKTQSCLWDASLS
jgi:hypothetical protein